MEDALPDRPGQHRQVMRDVLGPSALDPLQRPDVHVEGGHRRFYQGYTPSLVIEGQGQRPSPAALAGFVRACGPAVEAPGLDGQKEQCRVGQVVGRDKLKNTRKRPSQYLPRIFKPFLS
jgi:hypothetical protein